MLDSGRSNDSSYKVKVKHNIMGERRSELPPFPLNGVKLNVFLDFIEDMSGRQVFYKTVFDEEQSECSHDVP